MENGHNLGLGDLKCWVAANYVRPGNTDNRPQVILKLIGDAIGYGFTREVGGSNIGSLIKGFCSEFDNDSCTQAALAELVKKIEPQVNVKGSVKRSRPSKHISYQKQVAPILDMFFAGLSAPKRLLEENREELKKFLRDNGLELSGSADLVDEQVKRWVCRYRTEKESGVKGSRRPGSRKGDARIVVEWELEVDFSYPLWANTKPKFVSALLLKYPDLKPEDIKAAIRSVFEYKTSKPNYLGGLRNGDAEVYELERLAELKSGIGKYETTEEVIIIQELFNRLTMFGRQLSDVRAELNMLEERLKPIQDLGEKALLAVTSLVHTRHQQQLVSAKTKTHK